MNCMICESKSKKILSRNHKLERFERNFTLIECLTCNHVMIEDPPSKEELDEYYRRSFWGEKKIVVDLESEWKKILKSNSSSYERYLRGKRQYNYITSKIKIDKNQKIIDIGSGISSILYQFSKNNYDNLYALEFDKKICEFLELRKINTINSDIRDIVNSNNKFDLIIISHTLEHVYDPEEFIHLVQNISKKNTKLFIEVPFKDYLEPYNENFHLHFFSKQSLETILNKNQFKLDSYEIDSHNIFDKLTLKILFFFYKHLYIKSKKTIHKPSHIIEFIHKLWRPIRFFTKSKINIFISRRDIRTISNLN